MIFVKANGSILTHFLSTWLPATAGFGQRCPSPLPPQALPCTFQFLLKIEVTDSGEEISGKRQIKALDTIACTKVEVVMTVVIITTSVVVADIITLECGLCSQLCAKPAPLCPLPQSSEAEVSSFYREGKESHSMQQRFASLKKKKKNDYTVLRNA